MVILLCRAVLASYASSGRISTKVRFGTARPAALDESSLQQHHLPRVIRVVLDQTMQHSIVGNTGA